MSVTRTFECPSCQVDENEAKVAMVDEGDVDVEFPDTCWSCGHEFSDAEKNKIIDEMENWALSNPEEFIPEHPDV